MLTHELAHRVDRWFVNSWKDGAFSQAVAEAKQTVNNNAELFYNYAKEKDNEGFLSDILSALCEDDCRFPVFHEKGYWKLAGKKEAEVFANLFSLESIGDFDKLAFLGEYFPNVIRAYQKIKGW